MIERLIVLVLLFSDVNEAKMNHFVRTDTSAPELEIDQREYTNPENIKKKPERSTGEDITTQDNTFTNSLDAEGTETNRIVDRAKKDSQPKEISKDDSQWSNMKIVDFDEDLRQHEDELKDPGVISVSSYNIPKMPKKVYFGPQKKPFRQLPFNGIGPAGIDEVDKPSCNVFSRTARFNPYSVLNDKWFNFYRWSSDYTPLIVEFAVPTSWELNKIRSNLDQVVENPVSWSSRIVIMIDLMYNASSLLVERGDHGQFWMYPIMKSYTSKVAPFDVRFKQTGDNRYFGFVLCEDDRAFIFSRINDVPRNKEIPDVVAKVGWRGRDGQSYLYQGHKWGPVPELTEEEYWTPPKYRKEEEELPPAPIEDSDIEYEPIAIMKRKNENNKNKKQNNNKI